MNNVVVSWLVPVWALCCEGHHGLLLMNKEDLKRVQNTSTYCALKGSYDSFSDSKYQPLTHLLDNGFMVLLEVSGIVLKKGGVQSTVKIT